MALKFTSVEGDKPFDNTFTFFDATGANQRGLLDANGISPLKISARDTGLFILQPNIIKGDGALLNSPEGFELRGYVEISLTKPTPSEDTALLLTAEHRGTFFKNTAMLIEKGFARYAEASDLELDQIAYQLPMASGGSKFTFIS